MNELQIFKNEEFGEVRTVTIDNEPWFVGKDVAMALGYQNASKALADHVEECDKLNNESLSSLGQRGGWLINESGLYALIFGSKLESANEYIVNATHRWNIKSGAVRSGKSYVDTAFVIPFRIRERAGKPGLNVILGVSKESIERNVLQPMREIYTDKLIGTINNRNVARICGEDVYCLGAEKISQVAKIQGASIKYCYGDEVAKWNKEVFQMLKSRLDKPYSCFDGSCNPEHPTHWLKEFLDNIELDIYLQRYTIFDNPFLPEEFVQQLCKEYEGTIYYDRLILGMWKRAEGAIYKRFADNPDAYRCEVVEELNPDAEVKQFRKDLCVCLDIRH